MTRTNDIHAVAPHAGGRSALRDFGAVAVAIATLLTGAGVGTTAWAQKPVALVVVDVHAVALGYRASELRGKSVFNDRGEEIGKIDDLIIGRDKVLFVIVSVGGFLGLGERKVAVPYNSLHMVKDRIVLPGATKDALKKLPEFKYM